MSDAIPAAKLMNIAGTKARFWSCYNCKSRLVSAHAALHDREIWTCAKCGMAQVLGRAVTLDVARKAHNAVVANSTALPPNLNREKLALIQQTYDGLKKKAGKAPSQSKVYEFSGVARSTVREYWPFLRK